jgi:hypothetical protein
MLSLRRHHPGLQYRRGRFGRREEAQQRPSRFRLLGRSGDRSGERKRRKWRSPFAPPQWETFTPPLTVYYVAFHPNCRASAFRYLDFACPRSHDVDPIIGIEYRIDVSPDETGIIYWTFRVKVI